MAKTRRFQNSQKSAPKTHCATHPPTQAAKYPPTTNETPTNYGPQTHPQTQGPTLNQTQTSNHSLSHTQSAGYHQATNQAPTNYGPQTQLPTQSPTHNQTQASNHSLSHTQSAGYHQTTNQAQTNSSNHSEGHSSQASYETSFASAENTSHNSPQESQTRRPSIGRECASCWTVEEIDPEGVIKKIRLKFKQVEFLPRGKRIIVHFDDQGAAIGEAQGLLAGYLGTLAIDCKIFPINFDRWNGPRGVPIKYFNDCFEDSIAPRFCFSATEVVAKRYCKLSIGKKWAANRQTLWERFSDPTKTRDEIISNVPVGIDETQWAYFVTYRLTPKTQEVCQKNKEIRSLQDIPHTGGSKPNARLRHEMYLETGQVPSRGKVYIETHKKKDGSVVNDKAKAIVEQVEMALTQSNVDETEVSPNDALGRVFGPEHNGRSRIMGLGVTPSIAFRSTRRRFSNLNVSSPTATTSSPNIWQERYQNLEHALHGYLVRKEGEIPEEFIGVFHSSNASEGAREPHSPMDANGSFGASNI